MQSFLVRRNDFSQAEWEEETLPDLASGSVLLQIDSFSFTANNVSYAVTGDKLGYWQFFPAPEGYGKIPVWGFATVVASRHAQVAVGERFYGYFPPSRQLIVQPDVVKTYGFSDATPHRQQLAAVYNFYSHVAHDPLYDPNTEDFQSIFRPLFTTSFLLDDFFAENHFFEAQHIVLTSASSKTAFAMAFLLKMRREQTGTGPVIVGLTSEKNKAFVNTLGLYDKVLVYEAVQDLPVEKTCIVDFAGNQDLHYALEQHLGAQLSYNCLVGAVHWDTAQSGKRPQQKGKFFFAPTHAQKRAQEWGTGGFQQRLGAAWQQFARENHRWISIRRSSDPEVFLKIYHDVLTGRDAANNGNVFAF